MTFDPRIDVKASLMLKSALIQLRLMSVENETVLSTSINRQFMCTFSVFGHSGNLRCNMFFIENNTRADLPKEEKQINTADLGPGASWSECGVKI